MSRNSRWTVAAAGLEVLTGIGLVVAPSVLASLLFGSDLNASGIAVGRIAGLVMACLALGCLGASDGGREDAPLFAVSLLAALFLIYEGLIGTTVGVLLWPAAATHFILAILLAWGWMERRERAEPARAKQE